MQSNDRNLVIIGILLGVAALFSLVLCGMDSKQKDTVHIKDFPPKAGDWVSEDIPLSKSVFATLETDNALMRIYRDPQGQKVYLYIVYTQSNHKAYHPPEDCYAGTGVYVLEKGKDSGMNRMVLQDNKMYQLVYYWFKVGDTFTSSYWKQQALFALDALLGKREGGALIRVSADFTNNNKEPARKAIKEFTSLITPQLIKYLP